MVGVDFSELLCKVGEHLSAIRLAKNTCPALFKLWEQVAVILCANMSFSGDGRLTHFNTSNVQATERGNIM